MGPRTNASDQSSYLRSRGRERFDRVLTSHVLGGFLTLRDGMGWGRGGGIAKGGLDGATIKYFE